MYRRKAIVTGVSRLKGIGRAICLALAKQGIDIFFTYWSDYDTQKPWGINENEPDLIQKEIRELGVDCEKLEIDLSTRGSIQYLLKEIKIRLGEPHILINNAAYSTYTDIENLTAEELDKHYQINLKAVTLLTIEFIKAFSFNEGGRIINLTSGQSLGQMHNEIAYAVTKGAIETLTYTLSSKIASKGITINAVNPGPNDTGWITEELKEDLIKKFPMKRLGQPHDAANLIGFLVSKEAEWITGQIIHSEGGFRR